MDRGIEHVVRLLLTGRLGSDDLFEQVAGTAGCGASGGLVGSFLALFGQSDRQQASQIKIVSGMDFVAGLTNLEQKIAESDLIVTGEGSFDV